MYIVLVKCINFSFHSG